MENKKDIGKAISDKLASLDKSPKEQVWSGINAELQKKKRKRIGFFFFWGSTLALLIAGTIAAFYIYSQYNGSDAVAPINPKDTITVNGANGETITITISPKSSNDSGSKNDESNSNPTVVGNEEPGSSNATTSTDQNNDGSKNIFHQKGGRNTKNPVNAKSGKNTSKSGNGSNSGIVSSKSGRAASTLASKASHKKSKGKIAKKPQGKSQNSKNGKTGNEEHELLSAEANTVKKDPTAVDLSSLQGKNPGIAETETKAEKKDSLAAKKQPEKEKNINMYPKDSTKTDSAKTYRKFYVDAFASPTWYGTSSNTSILDRSLDSLPKKSEMKFSYGIGLTYDLTERLSVRIGYHRVSISYITKNAYFTQGPEGSIDNYSGIDYYNNVSNQSIFNAANFESNGAAKMDITQKISYTEIPLEIKYKFTTGKLAVKSSVGFSYWLLSKNSISILANSGYSQEIGNTRNLSSASLSLNLGLELEYPLFKNTSIFVEPMYNYQIKANSEGNYKPYLFGVHAGIRYSFNNK